MDNINMESLRVLISEVIAEQINEARAVKRAYVRTDVRATELLQELTEVSGALRELAETRKITAEKTGVLRAKLEELLLESRKLKLNQATVGEAIGTTGSAVSHRIRSVRKAKRQRALANSRHEV
jgi:hypothetical protein